MTRRYLWLCVVLCVMMQGFASLCARAGTTGALVGRVFDAKSGTPVSGARVSVASASQNATSVTDAGGQFRFLSLAPDTYVLSVESSGFDPVAVSGVTITADQSQSVPVSVNKSLRTIAKTTARTSGDLIRPGTTSDVYSVSGAAAGASQALGGPGSLTNAYGQIGSVPGVVVQQGQQGWFQQISIRGGDIDQVGYELDGIPVNRVYDNAPQTMLSTLGQQELQIYTGGTPATSDGQGLSGYVNQVIRTGTYPGFLDARIGVGGPAYLHQASLEFGGANKNRTLSYYVGVAGSNQDFRYLDQFQGASDPRFFYPIAYPFGDDFARFNLYDGSPNPLNGKPATVGNGLYFGPGNSYAIASLSQRDTVANVHVAIPHKSDSIRDDLQLLYVTSEIFNSYFSSVNDQGGRALVGNALSVGNQELTSGQSSWHDGYVYNGALFAPPNPSLISPYYFMSSPQPRAFDATIPDSARDTNDNGVAVLKVQYQKNFNARSYLRAYGYSLYSNWFITGQANQNFTCCFGAELNDYEIPSHTYGANLTYSNQLDAKNLFTLTGSYSQTKLQRRYYYQFPGDQGGGTAFTNLIDPANAATTGHCYDPASGGYTDCFNSGRGTFDIPITGGPAAAGSGLLPITATAFAGGAHPQFLVTENGPLARLNNVSPISQAASLTDQFRPNDRTTLSLGVRLENYIDRLADTTGGPDRAFWVRAYDNQYCYKPGIFGAVNVAGSATPNANGVFATPANCTAFAGAGYLPADFSLAGPTNLSSTQIQPRLAFTYAIDPDTVVRASYGVYSRPVNTSWLQYDDLNSRDFTKYAATNFLGFGFHTQNHDLRPDTSYNYDLSLEKHLRGSDISAKVTPFYRSTRDQLQSFPLGVGGIVSGFNVGHQTSSGVEVAVRKGDFGKDGFAAQLSYTHTHSRIKYSAFPSGINVIDTLNQYVQEYNSYTKGCAGTISKANASACGLAAGTVNGNAHGTFTSANGTVANPYFNAALQPLLDVNGQYTTYDQIPQPFAGENGYETPDVVALVTGYRKHGFSVTPSLTFSSGSSYGSPISYPGYIPNGGCTPQAGTTKAIPYTCSGFSAASGGNLDYLFIPDAFTGRFDGLGAFKQPSRLSLNLGLGYDVSKTVSFNVTLTGLLDKCFQRGYAWDDKNICVYSELPSGGAGLGPSGNFTPIASTPVQIRYPYGPFNNNLNTGFVGTTVPFEAAATMSVKL